jgi:SAM-dependent methyltransferase
MSAMADEMEVVACPACGSDSFVPRHVVRDHLFGQPGEFVLVRCEACHVDYLNPRPTAAGLARFYPSEYFCYDAVLGGRAGAARMGGLTRRLAEQRILQLESLVGQVSGSARILDVGCGANAFLYHLQRLRGCETLGVDFNERVVAAIRERLGMPALAGSLLKCDLPAAHFDGIGMYEYIEHEGQPLEVLRRAREVCRAGGWLAIETPNIESGLAKLFGRKWCQLDAPRHLVLYSPATITRVLERCGWRVIAVRPLTFQWMLGFSVLVALGFRNMGRLRAWEAAMGVAATLPFLPVPWFFPEFMRVYARAG